MDEPRIRKDRSLMTKGDGWSYDSGTYKNFRVNGASPDEGPSTATSKANRSKTCKRSPDGEHRHDNIESEFVSSWYEQMVYRCVYCGHKGDTFKVRTGPVPEWITPSNIWARRFFRDLIGTTYDNPD